jgi:hypothetical protein
MNIANNISLYDIHFLKTAFYFNLNDEAVIERTFYFKKYIYAIRIKKSKKVSFEDHYVDAPILSYTSNLDGDFIYNLVVYFSVSALKTDSKSFYMGWRRYLTIPIIEKLFEKSVNMYFDFKDSLYGCRK